MLTALHLDLDEEKRLIGDMMILQEEFNSISYQSDSNDAFYNEKKEIILDEIEEIRLRLITKWLSLNRVDAVNMRLSSIERDLKSRELRENRNINENLYELQKLLTEL